MDGRTDDGRTDDDGRTPEHGNTISSPCEPNGSGELKNQRTNGPVNAHLVSGPSISTKHTKPGYKWPSEF